MYFLFKIADYPSAHWTTECLRVDDLRPVPIFIDETSKGLDVPELFVWNLMEFSLNVCFLICSSSMLGFVFFYCEMCLLKHINYNWAVVSNLFNVSPYFSEDSPF